MAAKPQAETPDEIAVQSTDLTAPSPFQLLLRDMSAMATLDESEKRVSGEDINAILIAETAEEMWDADELTLYNAQKLSGCELRLYGFDVKYSTGGDENIRTPFVTPDGKQMYLLVYAARVSDTGDHKKEIRLPEVGMEFVWNTSARNIVGKLFWMLRHGWFDDGHEPVYAVIKGTPLGGGRSVEKLKEMLGANFAQGQTEDTPF